MDRFFLKVVFLLFLITISFPSLSQHKKQKAVITIVEEMPVYPGGDEALLRYISEELIYPRECKENGIMGVVLVTYCVNEFGKIDSVSVPISSNHLFNEEAVRVIESIKGYKPGTQDGKPVRVRFTIPIRFVLAGREGLDEDYVSKFMASEYYNLATEQYRSGKKEMALVVLNLAIQHGNDWFNGLYLTRGSIYLNENEFSKAKTDFERAITLEPLSFDGWFGKGKALQGLMLAKEAISAFKEAAKIDNSSTEVHQSMGLLQMSERHYDEAIHSFSTALSLNDSDGSTYYYRGMAKARLRNLDAACIDWTKAKNLGVKDAELLVETQCPGK